MSVIGNSPGVASQRVVSPFTATAGQTTFTPISGYTIGYCDVFLNGIKLANGDDYTASDGTTVVLAVGAALGDFVEVVAYFPRGLSDGYLKAEADARFPRVDTASQGLNSTQQGNARTNINAQAALGYTPVNQAGDTMTNDLIVSGTGKKVRVQDGSRALTIGQWDGVTNRIESVTGDLFMIQYGSAQKIRLAHASIGDVLQADSAGNVTLPSGNLVLASGKGIDFSATANSSGSLGGELLDDYETGTWTPTLTFGGSSGSSAGVSYSSQLGSYIKIGRMIYLNCRIALSNKGSGSGSARITGLPFFPVGGFNGTEMQIGSVWHNGWNNSSNYAINIRQDTTANNTFLEFRAYVNGSEAPVTESWLNNSSQFNVSIVVFSAS